MPSSSLPVPRRRPWALPSTCLAVLLGVAGVVEWWPTAGVARYRERAEPELILGRDKITKRNAAFLRAGLLRMSTDFCEPASLAADSPEALALYGQPCPAPDAGRFSDTVPPSTALLPPPGENERDDLAVVSVVCRGDDLFGARRGIVTNPHQRGVASERPAWFSARVGSRTVVESPIGFRIHGGHSRHLPHKSFDLVFREQYGGSDRSPAGLFFGPDTPPTNQLVLINAADPSRFNGALATDIAREAGCQTSHFVPAVVYLNGTLIKSPFFLYQHQSREFAKQRFHLREVDWVRLKSRQDRLSPAFVKWRQWIRKRVPARTMTGEAEHFDLDDLTAWALAMTFTSTTDCNQGAYFRDHDDPNAVWRTLVWDMDFAFNRRTEATADGEVNYAADPFRVLIGNRARLFFLLISHSPEYRAHFENLARETLTTRLTPERLGAMADRYVELARTHPAGRPELVAVMEDARKFLTTRHAGYLDYVHHALMQAGRDSPRQPAPAAAE